MLSTSNLTIEWVKPDIASERWEFSNHPEKQGFYLRHNIGWDQILSGFDAGRLVAYPRAGLINGVPVELSYSSYDDYARYLAKAKRGYRRNYSLMEESLQRLGTLTLPAPIILQCGDEALLFSGYRRLCLSWNYGMVPCVWLLPVSPFSPVSFLS
ncbi:hypothetical protein [Geobacter sp. AOG1]|uniref:hypothetical protein n=1 Tax=Geobacter sp. AOG1 TaxID=1566346 RepID=UPI001CC7E7EB|nr:hypothetical protein [Geobacter sp. AOG1]GFE56609.1 hypothetical protein AOG1_04880 [Geobacter sp. AOG1]